MSNVFSFGGVMFESLDDIIPDESSIESFTIEAEGHCDNKHVRKEVFPDEP